MSSTGNLTRDGRPMPEFTHLVDLASRRMGSSVSATNDELFAERENLIRPEASEYRPYTFGHKGQIYDGWETRRRREPGIDWAVVRLGVGGVVHGVCVDTAWFRGNFPPAISVQGAAIDGYPSPEELDAAEWFDLVRESPCAGDTENFYEVNCDRYVTHVRLCQHPDGGVARLRVYGEVVADPRFLKAGSVDLAALENGGSILGCSNMFYSAPSNLIAPGDTRVMGEGWETSRRRDDGNDWVEFTLAGPGDIHVAELDTRYFVGNAPGWARLSGIDARTCTIEEFSDRHAWVELLPKTRLQPDTRHRFLLGDGAGTGEMTHVRLDIYPDGGMARVRLWGELSEEGRRTITERWTRCLPDSYASAVGAQRPNTLE